MTRDAIRRILVVATPVACAMLGAAIGPASMPWLMAAAAGAVAGMIAMVAISASYSCVSYAWSEPAR
jgi:hypothetical protein